MRRASLLVLLLFAALVVAAPAGAHPQRAHLPEPPPTLAEQATRLGEPALPGATAPPPSAPAASSAPASRRGAGHGLTPPDTTVPITESLRAAAALPGTPWAALGSLAVLALVVAWRPRRVLALAVVLVLVVLAFETGVHSTHHLERPDDGARCVVAGALAKLSADLVDVTLALPCASLVVTRVAAPVLPAVSARFVAPHAGRAPPVLSA